MAKLARLRTARIIRIDKRKGEAFRTRARLLDMAASLDERYLTRLLAFNLGVILSQSESKSYHIINAKTMSSHGSDGACPN
jgi:hypothetical protein